MRLARYLAHAGVASRRGAERLIADGRVTVDGAPRDQPRHGGGRVPRGERRRPGRPARAARVPRAPQAGRSRLDRPGPAGAPERGRPRPVGRSPVSGRAAGRRELRAGAAHQRRRDGQPADAPALRGAEDLPRARCAAFPRRRTSAGCVTVSSSRTGRPRPRGSTWSSGAGKQSLLEISIHEGRKRIVRRMLEAVGHPALALERTGIGPLKLGRLAVGSVRRVRPPEVEALRRAAGLGNNPAARESADRDTTKTACSPCAARSRSRRTPRRRSSPRRAS